MDSNRNIVVIGLLGLLGVLSFFIIRPFLSFILLGLILAYMCHPVYRWLLKHMRSTYAAALILCGVFLGIIIPSAIIAVGLISQGNSAYIFMSQHATGLDSSVLFNKLDSWAGIDLGTVFSSAIDKLGSFTISSLPGIISSVGELIFGLVLLFLVLFYALIEGESWCAVVIDFLPVKKSHKNRVRDEMAKMTKSLFYGQLLIAVIIGVACGAVFFIFGINNPIFWGVIMGIFAFIPLFGAPVIYIPAGIILMMNNEWFSGISVIIACSLILAFLDYYFRQQIVNKGAEMHPLIIIIGAVGGVMLMGFVGFIIGPLVLNLLILLLRLEHDVLE